MMINEELLDKIAKLSRIKLNEEEKKKFLKQLNDILEAFKELEKVDVEGIQPSFQPIELKNVLRDDFPRRFEWDPLSNVHKNNREGKFVKGPKVIGE